MMTAVFIASDNICSPIGPTTADNFARLKKNISGVAERRNENISHQPFYASLFSGGDYAADAVYTKFERLLIHSIGNALENSGIAPDDKRTILIISSTKGNISLLEQEAYTPGLKQRIALHHSAKLVASHFKFAQEPLVVSNACISGILALLTGMRLIRMGQYDNAVVAGADVISRFIYSGFESFQAISSGPCRPFDKTRNGINLGEGAGTIILSSRKEHDKGLRINGGSSSNDANHISGPSRTGEELNQIINNTLKESAVSPEDIGFISAHGTATIYNDEMESKAIAMAGLQSKPVNSLKGYFGHTLGAAGLIESVVSLQSLRENLLLPTRGFNEHGVSAPINILTELESTTVNACLKTASGFGGCNAAALFSKQ